MHRVISCDSPETVSDVINGVVNLGPLAISGLPLGGLTLIFTTPARTVTFGSAGDVFTPIQVAAAIKAAHADFNPFTIVARSLPETPKLRKVMIQNNTGFTIGTAGTANTILGLSSIAPIVSAGRLTFTDFTITQGSFPGNYIVTIKGA